VAAVCMAAGLLRANHSLAGVYGMNAKKNFPGQ
jgi:hypothetical protein